MSSEVMEPAPVPPAGWQRPDVGVARGTRRQLAEEAAFAECVEEMQATLARAQALAREREEAFLSRVEGRDLSRHCRCGRTLEFLQALSGACGRLVYDQCPQCLPHRFLQRRYGNVGMPLAWRYDRADYEEMEGERGRTWLRWKNWPEDLTGPAWAQKRLEVPALGDAFKDGCFAFAWHFPQGQVRLESQAGYADLQTDLCGGLATQGVWLIGSAAWVDAVKARAGDQLQEVVWETRKGEG